MSISFEDVTYSYPSAPEPALADVSLEIEAGAFALLAGPSAGGKSTLLRMVNGLVPQFHGGNLSGRVRVFGLDPARTPARSVATTAGMVFQEPESQAITESVEDEIAFGMEQQGVPAPEMRARIDRLVGELGLDGFRDRRLATLSGGERQRVAIAAVLALEPRVLLLDEPTSQLDAEGADSFIEAVLRLRAERGLTVLIAEHRLERLLPACDRVIAVSGGRVLWLSPRQAVASLEGVPPFAALARCLGMKPLPLTLEEARLSLARSERRPTVSPRVVAAPGDELLAIDSLGVSFGPLRALAGASFTVRQGEVVALIGPNGSGKTTLLRAIAGVQRPSGGGIRLAGATAAASVRERTATAGLVPQDPSVALYHETVHDEVLETVRNRTTVRARAADELVAAWGLERLSRRNPRDLSVGQQQRVAIAAMLAHRPPLWLLDEPTRGADNRARDWLLGLLREHAASGGAAIVATHDVESAARFATRVIGLDAGEQVFDLPAGQAFAATGPLPAQIARLVPGAVNLEDLAW